MEDTQAAAAQELLEAENHSSHLSPLSPVSGMSSKSNKSVKSGGSRKKNGVVKTTPKSPPSSARSAAAPVQEFTGISCLLITWKSNPEVEQFKVLIHLMGGDMSLVTEQCSAATLL